MKFRQASLAATIALLPFSALAQGLPAGASSLSETYGDWQIACTLVEAASRCALSQTQVSNDANRQRILTMELTAMDASGMVSGTLILPFGLKLADGVLLRIDEQDLFLAQFSTCLMAGCLVPLSLDERTIAQVSSGTALTLKAATYGSGQEASFSISLSGLAPALARMAQIKND